MAALKVSPYIIHSVDYIPFWSFEISEGILRDHKIMIALDLFSNQRLIHMCWRHLDYSLCIDYPESWTIVAKFIGSLKRLK